MAIVFSAAAIVLALKAWRYAIEETEEALKYRTYGLVVLCFGFVFHTVGDFLSAYYGDVTELILESIAHLIILIAFVLFYYAAQQVIINTKGLWFK